MNETIMTFMPLEIQQSGGKLEQVLRLELGFPISNKETETLYTG